MKKILLLSGLLLVLSTCRHEPAGGKHALAGENEFFAEKKILFPVFRYRHSFVEKTPLH